MGRKGALWVSATCMFKTLSRLSCPAYLIRNIRINTGIDRFYGIDLVLIRKRTAESARSNGNQRAGGTDPGTGHYTEERGLRSSHPHLRCGDVRRVAGFLRGDGCGPLPLPGARPGCPPGPWFYPDQDRAALHNFYLGIGGGRASERLSSSAFFPQDGAAGGDYDFLVGDGADGHHSWVLGHAGVSGDHGHRYGHAGHSHVHPCLDLFFPPPGSRHRFCQSLLWDWRQTAEHSRRRNHLDLCHPEIRALRNDSVHGASAANDVGRTLSPRGALSSALAGLVEMSRRDWESRAG